jgi:DNA-binding LacI/PurR family transcriptional regulator
MGVALQFLISRGHRRAAYGYVAMYDWERQRLSDLRELCRASRDAPALCGYRVFRDEDWVPPRPPGLEGLLLSLHRHGPARVRAALGRFVAARAEIVAAFGGEGPRDESPYAGLARYALINPKPELPPARRHGADANLLYSYLGLWPALRFRATALIAPSDTLALSYHVGWLRTAGVAVPRDMSLISFDNSYRYEEQLTSVDFGFDYLGYQAYHTIVGDIPVERDRHGCIAARARVVDLGTVGEIT